MKKTEVKLTSLAFALIFLAASLGAQAQAEAKNSSNAPSQSSQLSPGNPALPDQPVAPAAGIPHDNSFVIGNDDVLVINVWKEPEVSRTLPVRSDGRISLPLVGEIQATGRTPLQLEQEIARGLHAYMTDPEVTVIVQEIHSQQFNILGQVLKPGAYPLTRTTTVLDAIAIAGGFRDFAKQKGIYILRQNPKGGESRIPFNYKNVIKGMNPAQNIVLEPRDTVVVP
jgi:polysaccharide export outer membrane protein